MEKMMMMMMVQQAIGGILQMMKGADDELRGELLGEDKQGLRIDFTNNEDFVAWVTGIAAAKPLTREAFWAGNHAAWITPEMEWREQDNSVKAKYEEIIQEEDRDPSQAVLVVLTVKDLTGTCFTVRFQVAEEQD